MGAAISMGMAEVGTSVEALEDQAERNAAQRQQDMVALSAILESKEQQFRQSLVMPDSSGGLIIPIDKIVKIVSDRRCDCHSGASDQLNEVVQGALGGDVLKALKGTILGALDVVLGSASAGEKTHEGFTVMLLHGAVVRIDYHIYTYTFKSNGVKNQLKNGLVFACALSTVKLTSVNSEVIALLSGLNAAESIDYMAAANLKLERIMNNAAATKYETKEAVQLLMDMFINSSTRVDPANQYTLQGEDAAEAANAQIAAKEKAKAAAPNAAALAAVDLTGEAFGEESTVRHQVHLLQGLLRKQRAGEVSYTTEEEENMRKKANKILLAQAAAGKHPAEDADRVLELQKKTLDGMISLYQKIAQMKNSTAASIKSAGGN